MAANLFWSPITLVLFLFCISVAVTGCLPGTVDCVRLSRDHTVVYVDKDTNDECCWKIFCYKGLPESIIFLWVNPVLKVKFNGTLPTKFITVKGNNEEEVDAQNQSYNLMFRILQWLRLAAQRDVEEIPFTAFNQSCIGVYSDVNFKAELFIKNLEPWLLAYLGFGIILFLSAESWSHNVKLHYGFGVSLGVLASILVLLFTINRMFPQSLKKIGYMLMAMGCSGYLYFWTYITRNILNSSSSIISNYWPWIMGYFTVSAIISFAVCYRYGPLTEPRTLNLIKWMLQIIALVFMYNGTQIREASVAIIVTLLTLYNIPSGVFDNRLTRFIRYRIFKPKIRLLSEEEYQTQGLRETRKALKELRSFCQSPECDAWKTMSRLSQPGRFADFVMGKSWHVTDEELLEYDSGPEVSLPRDPEDEMPVPQENNPPDSSREDTEFNNEGIVTEDTSDQSIDGPPLTPPGAIPLRE